jgi:hypothetical protein
MKLMWVDNKLMLGKVFVGHVFYSAFSSKQEPNKYKAVSFLPQRGSSVDLGLFFTLEEGQRELERHTNMWLLKAFSE